MVPSINGELDVRDLGFKPSIIWNTQLYTTALLVINQAQCD